ncbi:MAG: chemotaxis protein CheR [delta proteobacterium ML8_D]|jgi:chemotaxis protein methyltransferase CheR|nr:MAG: chemotaxis protein CheR [delta proteobacterium ML8_D]
MNGIANSQISSMSDRDFNRFRELIYKQCGINLTAVKRTMLGSRLLKRLRTLGIASFSEYYDYVSSTRESSNELVHMVDAVSTNKTDFFREPRHFDYLTKEALPGMCRSGVWRPGKRLNIWSAGCSSGEEPYTIAMVVADFTSHNRVGEFSILASDISTRVLEKARRGIYPDNAVEPVPAVVKRKYLMRGKGSQKGYCRVVPELRSTLHFQRINLNGSRHSWIRTPMDMIFCRNVIIYFDRETQKKLFEKFYKQLVPGGYLFIGHSETLHGVNDKFKAVAVATYRKPGG